MNVKDCPNPFSKMIDLLYQLSGTPIKYTVGNPPKELTELSAYFLKIYYGHDETNEPIAMNIFDRYLIERCLPFKITVSEETFAGIRKATTTISLDQSRANNTAIGCEMIDRYCRESHYDSYIPAYQMDMKLNTLSYIYNCVWGPLFPGNESRYSVDEMNLLLYHHRVKALIRKANVVRADFPNGYVESYLFEECKW